MILERTTPRDHQGWVEGEVNVGGRCEEDLDGTTVLYIWRHESVHALKFRAWNARARDDSTVCSLSSNTVEASIS